MVDQSFLMSPEDDNNKVPSFKNLLLMHIGRLKKSNDPLDKQLRKYLIGIIKDKRYSQATWIAEIEEVEQIHRLVKKGRSVNSAVEIVAEKSTRDKLTLQDKYSEYQETLLEIDQIFQESRTEDPE